jgi:hypothetical protein
MITEIETTLAEIMGADRVAMLATHDMPTPGPDSIERKPCTKCCSRWVDATMAACTR